jgi:hypothetical protein
MLMTGPGATWALSMSGKAQLNVRKRAAIQMLTRTRVRRKKKKRPASYTRPVCEKREGGHTRCDANQPPPPVPPYPRGRARTMKYRITEKT